MIYILSRKESGRSGICKKTPFYVPTCFFAYFQRNYTEVKMYTLGFTQAPISGKVSVVKHKVEKRIMKLMLFALTGMGNEIVKKVGVCRAIQEIVVITRKENGPFPYYDCQQLDACCSRSGIHCRYAHEFDSPGALTQFSLQYQPDVIAACTYHKIFPKELIQSAKIETINFHPSLLPHYRGPNPTNWAIIHGESQTGVTIHRMTTEVDAGDVLLQEKIRIENQTDGELRRVLYQLAGTMFVKLAGQLSNGAITARPMASGGSAHPGINSKGGHDLLRSGNFNRGNIIRGITPYPGASILEKDYHDV